MTEQRGNTVTLPLAVPTEDLLLQFIQTADKPSPVLLAVFKLLAMVKFIAMHWYTILYLRSGNAVFLLGLASNADIPMQLKFAV